MTVPISLIRGTLLLFLLAAGCSIFGFSSKAVTARNPVLQHEPLVFTRDGVVDINCSDQSVEYEHRIALEGDQICYEKTSYIYTGNAPAPAPVFLENDHSQSVEISLSMVGGPVDAGRCDKRPEWRYARIRLRGCQAAPGFITKDTTSVTAKTAAGFRIVRWSFEQPSHG